ncbi:MAG: RNA polymerase factor sigma-54, partial [Pseudomonadales bacterium]
HSRNETLLKVASKIVEHQKAFLDLGEEQMKPLILAHIANDVDMHESTISRVTTRKYMHTPRGIFELKYFFSSHVQTAAGGECSSTAIRAIIKKLVASENARKPLSDNKIAKVLHEQGIQVARRTIAKYREAMGILPSNERKRLS